jgi:hypothetical protein
MTDITIINAPVTVSVAQPGDVPVIIQAPPLYQVDATTTGLPGAPGVGVPAGGATGRVLAKKSAADYDTEWIVVSGGGSVAWADITGKPAFATVATTGSYADLTGIPGTFAPSAHGHVIGEVTGLTTALAGLQPLAAVLTGTTASFTTAQETKLSGIAAGATVNSPDATLLARGNHTGTQTAATISDFTEAAQDAVGGAFDATLTYSDAGNSMGRAALTGDATAPAGSNAVTLATVNGNVGSWGLAGSVAQFTVNAKGLITAAVNVAISIAASAISDSTAAGRAMLTAATVAAQTALLNVFTTTLKGLVPAPGSASGLFLRDDGTWAASGGGSPVTVQDEGTNVTTALGTMNFVGAGVTVTGGATATVTIPGGGGSPGGASGDVQFNNAAAFGGATDVKIEGGQLRLLDAASVAAPASGGVKLVGLPAAGRSVPGFVTGDGLLEELQKSIARSGIGLWKARTGSTSLDLLGGVTLTAVGTATAMTPGTANRHQRSVRLDYLVTVAATSAVAGFRMSSSTHRTVTVGGAAAGEGGFSFVCRWGPATGVATTTHRAAVGLINTITVPTDVEPSTLVNTIFMGWDAADANVQMMHNDVSGTCTKIDLGASFPVPTADRTALYELELHSPPGTTQAVNYRVTDLVSGAVASGQITTNLPTTGTLLGPVGWMSVGGTSSVIGVALLSMMLDPLI